MTISYTLDQFLRDRIWVTCGTLLRQVDFKDEVVQMVTDEVQAWFDQAPPCACYKSDECDHDYSEED